MRARVNRGPTRDEAVEMRLAEMYDAFTSGLSQDTGRLIRSYRDPLGWDEGEVVGRIPGVKPAFPESMQLSEGPTRIAKAIREKKGVTYDRILHAVRGWADRQDFAPTRKRKSAPPTVPAHEGRATCRHCGTYHTRGQHRFHGKGSFHRTHLWAFNSMKPTYTPHVEFKPTVRQAQDIVNYATKYGIKGMDRDLLAKARAKLRQVRKPVSNPRRRSTVARPVHWQRSMPATAQDVHYHGYVIQPRTVDGTWQLFKNGFYLMTFPTVEAAKREIDLYFTNPRRKATGRAKPNPGGQVIGYVEKLYYRRTVGKHRGYYQHTFKTRAEVVALPNGTVLLRPAK